MIDQMDNEELRQAIKGLFSTFRGEDLSDGQVNDFIDCLSINGLELKLVDEEED